MATSSSKDCDNNNVIVFGPTGDVGGFAALEASRRGAKVWLAMRDMAKTVAVLQEEKSSFERVRADLSDAASVTTAVRTSGATAAFVYLVPTNDGLRSSLAAMQAAGIEFVVFISTYSIPSNVDVRAVPASSVIAFEHAAVEAALEDLQLAHVALRPAYFASNPFKLAFDLSSSSTSGLEAYVSNGDCLADCIAPDDIGRVAGALLASSSSSSSSSPPLKRVYNLCGPQLLTFDAMLAAIGRVAEVGVNIHHVDAARWVDVMADELRALPRPAAVFLTEYYARGFVSAQDARYAPAVANVKELTGRDAMSFDDYLRLHCRRLLPGVGGGG
ncbi:NmrA-like family protein [Phyllosticta capitalensis]